jgi:hypothetical protein
MGHEFRPKLVFPPENADSALPKKSDGVFGTFAVESMNAE